MTYRSKVATVFLLGFFLDLINMFIASVAFPAMGRTLHASVGELAWVSNGYIAGLTLVLPFSAWLSQQFGTRRVFLLSLSIFSFGALAAGMADSLTSLVVWRALQGMGGGLLIPPGQSLTWQQFRPHERAKLSAAVMLVGLLAFGLAALWIKDERRVARPGGLLRLSLLRDPLLRFSMLVYLCVPGTFIGINVVGMFYLQSVTGMSPSAIGALMLPWSLASFVAIATTGRYFNRLGPRPLIAVGCLLQAVGIVTLAGVNAHTASSMLIAAFIFMGAGGSLCSSTAQSSAFLNVANGDMPDASALWNLNRQLSFLMGSALLAALLSAFLLYWPTPQAWRGVFIAAAALTLAPLLGCLTFDNRAIIMRLHGKMENK
ncbi:multidrug efflux MFS transporter [Klebsiella michiganensis]|uniref:MFS transporter n=1 Tax=Klebsiella michiganensis TaxID=1134687 RepID=UPI001CCB7204|nr:MFS transporter [Klebsiella michiganensis]MBZ7390010.1 multidrug efflux MFS transporter [Klebsiella michiganensis]